MTDIKIYENKEFGRVRVTEHNGEPWFVAKDVCDILDLKNPSVALQSLEDDERTKVFLGRQGEANCINESGLYTLIIRSNKPVAKRFRKWITADVLPTIRKTGGYVADETQFVQTYLPFADENTKAIFQQTLHALREASRQLEEAKPKVVFADAVAASKGTILIGDLAKLLHQNGVQIGQQRLFEWMRQNGYLIRQKGASWNMPTQRSMEMGLFEVKETAIPHADGHVSISRTTKVTGKGQQYFINAFLRNNPQVEMGV